MQFSSQAIKYERIKLGNRKDKKNMLELIRVNMTIM
jgi:hypothetical protein